VRGDPVYVLGRSTGSDYAAALGAVEPRVAGVIPTGSAGLWSLELASAPLIPGIAPDALGPELLDTTAPLTHLHPALQLIEAAWEAAEPMAFAPRIARRTLRQHAPRPIYQPVGEDDPEVPEPIYDAMALAYGNQQAGNIVWSSMQAALASDHLDGLANYPVQNNRASDSNAAYTGVVVQYEGDGIVSSRDIAFQLDAVKFQYGCVLASLEYTGVAVVPAPAPLGSGCSD